MQTCTLYAETAPKRVSDERVVYARNKINANSEYTCAEAKPRMWRGKGATPDIARNVNAQAMAPYIMRASRIGGYRKQSRPCRTPDLELARHAISPMEMSGCEHASFFIARAPRPWETRTSAYRLSR